jgi:hypothetical protein
MESKPTHAKEAHMVAMKESKPLKKAYRQKLLRPAMVRGIQSSSRISSLLGEYKNVAETSKRMEEIEIGQRALVAKDIAQAAEIAALKDAMQKIKSTLTSDKDITKSTAITMRLGGASFGAIADELGVKKAAVQYWCKNIKA